MVRTSPKKVDIKIPKPVVGGWEGLPSLKGIRLLTSIISRLSQYGKLKMLSKLPPYPQTSKRVFPCSQVCHELLFLHCLALHPCPDCHQWTVLFYPLPFILLLKLPVVPLGFTLLHVLCTGTSLTFSTIMTRSKSCRWLWHSTKKKNVTKILRRKG